MGDGLGVDKQVGQETLGSPGFEELIALLLIAFLPVPGFFLGWQSITPLVAPGTAESHEDRTRNGNDDMDYYRGNCRPGHANYSMTTHQERSSEYKDATSGPEVGLRARRGD